MKTMVIHLSYKPLWTAKINNELMAANFTWPAAFCQRLTLILWF